MTQEIKHTPAPWHTNVSSRYPIYAEKTKGKKDWQYIVNIPQGERSNTTEEEREANYALIAAAPEMLREMEALAQALEDTGHEPPQSFFGAINKARGIK